MLFVGCIPLFNDIGRLILSNVHRQFYHVHESFNYATNAVLVQVAERGLTVCGQCSLWAASPYLRVASPYLRAAPPQQMSSQSCTAVANVRAALLWPTTSKGFLAVVITTEGFLCQAKSVD